MKKEIVSIIVPIYNTSQYLKRCIDSILIQSYCYLDIVLIDDGSEDESKDIIDEYMLVDKRIRSIKIKHQGVSVARNVGIENALGKYIVFIDSDDYVSESYIEKLMFSDSDFVQQGVFWEHNNMWTKLPEQYIDAHDYIAKIEEIKSNMDIFNPYILWAVYGKRYKTQIIKNRGIRFPENQTTAEDAVFVFSYLSSCSNAVFLKQYEYFYCNNSESISSKKNISFLEDDIEALNSIQAFFKTENCKEYYHQWMIKRREYIYSYYKKKQTVFTDEEKKIISKKMKSCKYFDWLED